MKQLTRADSRRVVCYRCTISDLIHFAFFSMEGFYNFFRARACTMINSNEALPRNLHVKIISIVSMVASLTWISSQFNLNCQFVSGMLSLTGHGVIGLLHGPSLSKVWFLASFTTFQAYLGWSFQSKLFIVLPATISSFCFACGDGN